MPSRVKCFQKKHQVLDQLEKPLVRFWRGVCTLLLCTMRFYARSFSFFWSSVFGIRYLLLAFQDACCPWAASFVEIVRQNEDFHVRSRHAVGLDNSGRTLSSSISPRGSIVSSRYGMPWNASLGFSDNSARARGTVYIRSVAWAPSARQTQNSSCHGPIFFYQNVR